MPNPNHLLTDRLLAQLYLNLARDYERLQGEGRSEIQIYNELHQRISYSLQGAMSSLSSLAPEEQEKAFNVLSIFMEARCSDSFNHQHAREALQQDIHRTKASVVVVHHYPVYCRHNDNIWLTWMMMNSLSRPLYPRYPHSASHHHGHRREEDKKADALSILAVIAISTVALGAVYYTVNEALNACERFYHNEGWLQASITLLGGVTGAVLTATLAESPATSLALAAGLSNPAGWAALVLGALGLAAGFFIINQIQDRIINNQADALVPNDPNRFSLSKAEIRALEAKEIDPDRVKCAIVALRAKMGEQRLPSFTSRFFGYHAETQGYLEKVRQLRRGELREVEVGEMHFYLEKPRVCAYQPPQAGAAAQEVSRDSQVHQVPEYENNVASTGARACPPPPYDGGSYAYQTEDWVPKPSAPSF